MFDRIFRTPHLLLALFLLAMVSIGTVRMPKLSMIFLGEFHSMVPAFSYLPVWDPQPRSGVSRTWTPNHGKDRPSSSIGSTWIGARKL